MVAWKTLSSVLGVVSALALHVVSWTMLALVTTLGLAVADASAVTFYVTWGFFAGVVVAGTVLSVRWGRQGRRWLWRITVSWTLLFVLAATTLLVALIPLALLCLQPRIRAWVASCLVPPPPPRAPQLAP